jgi:phosphotransferase system enzyme I (PtsI)
VTAEIRGTGIGSGIAQGPVAIMASALEAPASAPSSRTPDEEKTAVAAAVSAVAAELNARGERAGGSAQDVLEAQAMMAEDPTLEELVHGKIDEGATGEYAVYTSFNEFAEQLKEMGGYLGERAADLADVAQRIIAHLRGVSAPGVPEPGHPFVLVAPDLAPADTALLDLDQVLAVVTTDGGPTSHTAILAREKGIVAVVGTGEIDLVEGQTVIVDASQDLVIADPSAEQLEEAAQRAADRAAAQAAPITPGALADGTTVPLLANLGSPAGAADAIALGAPSSSSSRATRHRPSRARRPAMRNSSRRSRAGRSSSAHSMRVLTSRSPSSRTTARRTRPSAAAASAPSPTARTSCATS